MRGGEPIVIDLTNSPERNKRRRMDGPLSQDGIQSWSDYRGTPGQIHPPPPRISVSNRDRPMIELGRQIANPSAISYQNEVEILRPSATAAPGFHRPDRRDVTYGPRLVREVVGLSAGSPVEHFHSVPAHRGAYTHAHAYHSEPRHVVTKERPYLIEVLPDTHSHDVRVAHGIQRVSSQPELLRTEYLPPPVPDRGGREYYPNHAPVEMLLSDRTSDDQIRERREYRPIDAPTSHQPVLTQYAASQSDPYSPIERRYIAMEAPIYMDEPR